jgi:hypothetical protein
MAKQIYDVSVFIRRLRYHRVSPVSIRAAAGPAAPASSRDHPAIQVADIVAGRRARSFTDGLPGCEAIAESIWRHGHPHSFLSDMELIAPATRSAIVNALILYDLARRAERHGGPYENLEEMYQVAEVS